MCPARDHFIVLALLVMYIIFVLSLTQMLVCLSVCLSLYVMTSVLLSILVLRNMCSLFSSMLHSMRSFKSHKHVNFYCCVICIIPMTVHIIIYNVNANPIIIIIIIIIIIYFRQ